MEKLRHSQVKKHWENSSLVDLTHKKHKENPSDRKEKIPDGTLIHVKNTEHWER